jgi:ankyrin repeat protein
MAALSSSGRQDRNGPSILLLIDRGADVNASAEDGNTTLSLAVSQGLIDVVRALLAKGADPNKKTSSRFGNSNGALLDLLGSGFRREVDVEMAMLLIDKGADVNATQQNGKTPLILATEARQIDIVRALLAKGADPNKASNNHATPLSASIGAPEIQQVLINAGAKQGLPIPAGR